MFMIKEKLKKMKLHKLFIAISANKSSKIAAEKARNSKCSILKFYFLLGFLAKKVGKVVMVFR